MRGEREPGNAYPTASTVSVEDGIVFVDGPDGVAIAFTPDAADETGSRLKDAAVKARGDVEPGTG